MVGLRPPREDAGDIEIERTEGELAHRPPGLGAEGDRELSRARADLLASVAVDVLPRPLDRRPRARLVQDALGGHERALHGAAEMRQVAAAEDPVPVGVVGLAAPEILARGLKARVVGAGPERLVQTARQGEHDRIRIAHLRILHEKVAPEAAAKEPRQSSAIGQGLEPASRLLELLGGGGGQRPVAHLRVGGGGQIDGALRRRRVEAGGKRRHPEPRRRYQGLEESREPSLFIREMVRARPHSELLAVVEEGQRPRLAPRLEIAERLFGGGEGHEVAEALADGKDGEPVALLLGQVVAAQGLGLEPGEGEMGIVEKDELHAGAAEDAGQLRLPHALGQPHAPRADAEIGAEELGQGLDLPDLVLVGQHGEDGLVEAAREDLHTARGHEAAQQVEGRGRPLPEEGEETAGAVHGHHHPLDGAGGFEKGMIGPGRRLEHDGVEVADGLMVVNAEEEAEPFTHDRCPGAGPRGRRPWPRAPGAATRRA